jgi:nucleotide-binding universal stress UspA family protein
VNVVSVVPESEARGSKAGGHRWLAPHAHLDVAVAHRYLDERGLATEIKILHGDPVEEICREVRTGGYDLIVAGSRQRGTVGRLMLGTVSGRLVNEAPMSGHRRR